jgi:hypothetical protein
MVASLALPLFVTRVAADDEHSAPTAHQLAVFADSLDARSNLHGGKLSIIPKSGKSSI